MHRVHVRTYNMRFATISERLKSLDWVDPKTASQIRLKIDRTNELFGYPDVIMNATALDSTYELFWVSEREFFQNQARQLRIK